MTYTLTLCIHIWLSMCVQTRTFDFADRDACERERAAQLKVVGNGYAVCAPKKPEVPA